MLPLSVVPIWAFMTKTDDGSLMYLRGRYAIAAPATPHLDEQTAQLAVRLARDRIRGVPVLVYHGLGRTSGELVDARYIVSRRHFAEHMRALELAGYTAITTGALARYLRSGSPRDIPGKPVLITFDDGRADAMIQAEPILSDTGMRATMFVIGEAASGFSFYYEPWKELRSFAARDGNWELANHSYALHRRHDDVKGREPISALVRPKDGESIAQFEARIADDLLRAQVALRSRGNATSSAFSYPYGDWGQHARRRGVVDAVQRAIRKHVAVAFDQDGQAGWRFALPGDDPLHVHRLEVQDQTGAQLLARLRVAEQHTQAVYAERGLDVPYRPKRLAAAGRIQCPPIPAEPISGRPAAGKVVALTFDGGPGIFTPQILYVLAGHGERATFFVTGMQIEGRERLLWKMILGGNEIGNGTWSRQHARTVDAATLTTELSRTTNAIAAAARVRPCVSRPPFREQVERHTAVSTQMKMATALWSVDPRDFARRSPAALASRVLDGVRPGAVIVLHDGGGDRWVTVQALGRILVGLERRGYSTVTLSQLRRAVG
jgi:peptidoglycan/xylan/chitin deacetylase (PgdA/CDA1 family)